MKPHVNIRIQFKLHIKTQGANSTCYNEKKKIPSTRSFFYIKIEILTPYDLM